MTTSSISPLIAEPRPPWIESQAAIAQGAGDIAEMAQWRFELHYRAEHMAQDEVIVSLSFNLPPAEAPETVAAAAPPSADYRLSVRLLYGAGGETIEAVQLTCESESAGPGGRWPRVGYRSSADAQVDLGEGVGEGEGVGTVRRYGFDTPLHYEYWPGLELCWDALGVAGVQNARAALVGVRNRGLVATGAAAHVVVYRTATIEMPGSVAPAIQWAQDFDLGVLDATLEAALGTLLSRLFGTRSEGQRLALAVQYGYAMQTGDTDVSLPVYLPAVALPDLLLQATTAAQVAAVLDDWLRTQAPPASGAHWAISLRQFSQVDTPRRQPLLDLPRLVYRLGG